MQEQFLELADKFKQLVPLTQQGKDLQRIIGVLAECIKNGQITDFDRIVSYGELIHQLMPDMVEHSVKESESMTPEQICETWTYANAIRSLQHRINCVSLYSMQGITELRQLDEYLSRVEIPSDNIEKAIYSTKKDMKKVVQEIIYHTGGIPELIKDLHEKHPLFDDCIILPKQK